MGNNLSTTPWRYYTFTRNEADGKLEYVGGELDVRGMRRSNMAEYGIMLMSFKGAMSDQL